MLTAIPEVDLGMDCVSLNQFSFVLVLIITTSILLQNIEEMEKAKLTLSDGRSRDPRQPDGVVFLSPLFTMNTSTTLLQKPPADAGQDEPHTDFALGYNRADVCDKGEGLLSSRPS